MMDGPQTVGSIGPMNGYPESYTLVDRAVGLRAYVLVDSSVAGRAMGGIRMMPHVTASDVAGLARQMSLKLALARLPVGGAKAGIQCGLPRGPQRDRVLRSFGRQISSLLTSGVYLGTDQGVTYGDRAIVFESAGYDDSMISPHRRLPSSWRELWEHLEGITGHGVAEAAYLAAHHFGLWRAGIRVAVQGFGVVGRGTVRGLARYGAMLVAVADEFGSVVASGGLPVDVLLAATDRTGTIDRRLLPGTVLTSTTRDAWLDVDADILVLAAGGGALHADNVNRVGARLVVEGANSPCTRVAIDTLAARGIPVVPGIVANSGSASVTALVLSGMLPDNSDVESVRSLKDYFFDHVGAQIRGTLLNVIAHADIDRLPLYQAAEDLATQLMAVGANQPTLVHQNREDTRCR